MIPKLTPWGHWILYFESAYVIKAFDSCLPWRSPWILNVIKMMNDDLQYCRFVHAYLHRFVTNPRWPAVLWQVWAWMKMRLWQETVRSIQIMIVKRLELQRRKLVWRLSINCVSNSRELMGRSFFQEDWITCTWILKRIWLRLWVIKIWYNVIFICCCYTANAST